MEFEQLQPGRKAVSNKDDLYRRITAVGALILNDHFVYASWKHGDKYFNKDAIYPHIGVVRALCEDIALRFLRDPEPVDVVVGPENGAIILSQWTAEALNRLSRRAVGGPVLSLYSEKVGEGFELKRGYDKLVKGKNVLVVEDVLTTGESARKTIDAVQKHGGKVVGLGVLNNRAGLIQEQFGVPKLYSVFEITMEAHEAKDCPFCKEGRPINTSVGHGREFLEKRGKAA